MTDKTPEGRKSDTMPLNMREKAKEIYSRLYISEGPDNNFEKLWLGVIERALLEVREQTVRECAEIAERQIAQIQDNGSETGGMEECLTIRNCILFLREKSRIEREGK